MQIAFSFDNIIKYIKPASKYIFPSRIASIINNQLKEKKIKEKKRKKENISLISRIVNLLLVALRQRVINSQFDYSYSVKRYGVLSGSKFNLLMYQKLYSPKV